MEGEPRTLLRGRFASPGPGGARYELTLSRQGLGARRLEEEEEEDGGGGARPPRRRGAAAAAAGRASLPLRHVLACWAGGMGELALTCYLPRGGRAGGGPYRRMVKTFRVEADEEEEGGGSRALAERWATAIRCLLLGIELPEEPE
ncbi:hypothetical protein chiPu_0026300, partial [Chiloscyllium punctatum]|nr:hypothetical protein [Chiloscyllium punctatum]